MALVEMTVAANAADYTGTVSNLVMKDKPQNDISGITFRLNGNKLTGNFNIAVHSLLLNATITETNPFTGNGNGRITIGGLYTRKFTCEITNGVVSNDGTLTFHCTAHIDDNPHQYSFTFTGKKVSD